MNFRVGRLSDEFYDDLLPRWRSIGITFARNPIKYTDPEKTILDSLLAILTDAKMLYLIGSWFKKLGGVIHTERLLSLAKARGLSYDEWMALGALAAYACEAGHRMDAIVRYAKRKVQKGHTVATSEHIALPVTMGQCLPEPTFKAFGIIVPTMIEQEAKIVDLSLAVKTSAWIRNRIFFGCNWRADIYTALGQKRKERASTYRIAKDLGCSNETALRIRKSFELLQEA